MGKGRGVWCTSPSVVERLNEAGSLAAVSAAGVGCHPIISGINQGFEISAHSL